MRATRSTTSADRTSPPYRRSSGPCPYLFGDSPTSFDAVAYGFLVNLITPPIESPLKDHALTLPNLPPYCARIRERYYADPPA